MDPAAPDVTVREACVTGPAGAGLRIRGSRGLSGGLLGGLLFVGLLDSDELLDALHPAQNDVAASATVP